VRFISGVGGRTGSGIAQPEVVAKVQKTARNRGYDRQHERSSTERCFGRRPLALVSALMKLPLRTAVHPPRPTR